MDENSHFARAAEHDWFHSIDFGNGRSVKGQRPLSILQQEAELVFKHGVLGNTVLDIGAWDGFFSFEAKRRGASRVLATDHHAWVSETGRFSQTGFHLARQILKVDVEDRHLDLPELRPDTVGSFDTVLFLGVFYHLKNPLLALESIFPLVKQTLVLETHLDALDVDRPAMIFYPGDTLNKDTSNWWGPNPECVKAMLMECGFRNVDFNWHPVHVPKKRGIFSNKNVRPARGIFHAHR
jgi:tRNA (mo5U34)-methyltransferase